MRLRVFEGGDDLERLLEFGWRRCKGAMNDLDLHGMNATHAFKAHGARGLTPAEQAVGVGNVAVNRIDGLDVRRVRGIHHPLTRVERLVAGGVFTTPRSAV